MRSFYVAGLLAALTVHPIMAQDNEKFAACVKVTGPEYVKARDQFLAAKPTEEFLKSKAGSNDWQERLTAVVLLGWVQHPEEYRQLLAAPRVTSRTGAAHYLWVRPDGIKAADVPLMYELLMKGNEESSALDAARALLGLVEKKPQTPLDVRLLHQFLRDGQSATATTRPVVAWLIGALPARYQEAKDLQASLQAELKRKDGARGIVESLLDGLGRAAAAMNDRQKDELVQNLTAMQGLEQAVGQVPFIYALGNIGGDKGSELVVKYLEQTPDEFEKRWALNTLSRSDSLVATKTLLKYADEAKKDLREEAIAGLGRTRYTPEVGAKLEAIALDNQVPQALQSSAVYSLASIRANHPQDKGIQDQIEKRLQTISASKPENDKIRNDIKRIFQNLKDRP